MIINFDKLYSIPYIKQFDRESFTHQAETFYQQWQDYTDHLDDVALIRAVECTNGCVQYALRDSEPFSLSIDQSRECMKLSMGFILHKEIQLSTHLYRISPVLYPILDEVRELYIQGFKHSNTEALQQFYAHSVAQFNIIQKPRIDHAIDIVRTNFTQVFTTDFIDRGYRYMLKFLTDHD